MPLPPEFLKLKRKRNEELPDTLFIQKEHRDPKRSFTDTAWHFRRVSDVPSLSSSPRSATRAACHKQDNTHLPQVPTVRATLPGEEHLRTQTREYNQRHNTSRSDHDKISVLFQHVSTQSHDDKVKLVPRRFHLTKDSISYSRQVQASKGGILKHRKGVPETLPIFSERTKEFLSGILLDKESSSQGREEPQEAPKPLLRRPNASATEKKWRDQNWKKPFQQPAAAEVPVKLQAKEEFLAIQRDYETLKLAAELQKFALEQTEGDVILEQHVRCAKLRSKQPPNSQAHDQSHDSLPDDHATNGNQEDESDWIVETYVRKANPVPADDANMKITDPQKELVDFGLLVIPEEDEPAWEIFADEEPGDSDEGSESSDSNAEDYYTNDYPEDEVNSDDEEYGRGTYRYRNADSEDEEYDEDVMSYSDEEEHKPWRRSLCTGGNASAEDDEAGKVSRRSVASPVKR